MKNCSLEKLLVILRKPQKAEVNSVLFWMEDERFSMTERLG